MSTESHFAAACASIALACAWAPVPEANAGSVLDRVRLDYNLGDQVTHAVLMLDGPGSGDGPYFYDGISLPGPGSGGGDFPFTGGTELPTRYAIIGVYNGSGPDLPAHLLVSCPVCTALPPPPFDVSFAGWSEPLLIEQLRLGNPAALGFLVANFDAISAPLGSITSAAAYSDPFIAGDITVSLVPAPGLLAATPLALLAVARRRRSVPTR